MKKNIFVLFTLSVFLFFGCNFISTTSFQSDIATVKINFSQNKANPILNARTIDPGYPENLNNLVWTVTYAGSDGLSKTAETKNGAYLFPVGTWIITATADNLNSNGRFTGSKEVTISTGTNNISLTVEFDKDGFGGFTAEYTLTGELEKKATADFELFFLKYPSLAEVDIEVPFSVTGNKLTVSNLDVLPAGFYQISLLTTDLEIITLTDDIVEIAAEATSHFSGKAYLDSKSRIYYAVEEEGSLYNGYSPAYRASLTTLLEKLKNDSSWKTATIKLENKIDDFSPESLIDYANGRQIILVSEADGKIFAEVKDGEVVEQPAQDPGNGGTGSGGTQEPGSGSTGTGSTGTQDPVIPTDPVTYNTLYVSSSGSDSNAGASKMTPLKTLERAVELLENGGTIYLMSDITLTSGVSIDKKVKIELQEGIGDITILGLSAPFTNSDDIQTSTMFYVKEGGELTINGCDQFDTDGYIESKNYIYLDGNKSNQNFAVEDDFSLIDARANLNLYNIKIQNSKCKAISAYGENCETNINSCLIGDSSKNITSANIAEASISDTSGAAINIGGDASVYLAETTISGIYSSSTTNGGTIYMHDGLLIIDSETRISGNYSEGYGGAIYTTSYENEIQLRGGQFINNKARLGGDSIYLNDSVYMYVNYNYSSEENINDLIITEDNPAYIAGNTSQIVISTELENEIHLIVENCTNDGRPENKLIYVDRSEYDNLRYSLIKDSFIIYEGSKSGTRYYLDDSGNLITN